MILIDLIEKLNELIRKGHNPNSSVYLSYKTPGSYPDNSWTHFDLASSVSIKLGGGIVIE